ncbi:hypothetical protein HDV00_000571 [Rhizophlyctis rosea]|nr:hypothetical protein HDV00_000571 [Rhizophlyctis rosea]
MRITAFRSVSPLLAALVPEVLTSLLPPQTFTPAERAFTLLPILGLAIEQRSYAELAKNEMYLALAGGDVVRNRRVHESLETIVKQVIVTLDKFVGPEFDLPYEFQLPDVDRLKRIWEILLNADVVSLRTILLLWTKTGKFPSMKILYQTVVESVSKQLRPERRQQLHSHLHLTEVLPDTQRANILLHFGWNINTLRTKRFIQRVTALWNERDEQGRRRRTMGSFGQLWSWMGTKGFGLTPRFKERCEEIEDLKISGANWSDFSFLRRLTHPLKQLDCHFADDPPHWKDHDYIRVMILRCMAGKVPAKDIGLYTEDQLLGLGLGWSRFRAVNRLPLWGVGVVWEFQ